MERELTLHVPATARPAIVKALRADKARRVTLQARYFDTPARELARAGVALRVRLEGRRWVQTVKAPGPDALTRLELNHPRTGPELDLSLYDGTPLAGLLARLSEPLGLRYETRVARLAMRVESRAATVEVAYDHGVIVAGGLELPISEVEFEQIAGAPEAVFDLGRQWLLSHGLVLELRSKAQRGDLLAQAAGAGAHGAADTAPGSAAASRAARGGKAEAADGAAPAPPPPDLFRHRRSRHVRLSPDMDITQAYLACANECLTQIICNATLAAGVDTARASAQARAEYIHQLRVGMRRLRSCWKLFKPWMPAVDRHVADTLRRHFALFGSVRDDDVIRLDIMPRLLRAGMPVHGWPGRAAPDGLAPGEAGPDAERDRPATQAGGQAAQAAGGQAFQACLLELLRHVVLLGDAAGLQPAPSGKDRKPRGKGTAAPAHLGHALVRRLDGWRGRIAREGEHFVELSIDDQHDLRKEVKTLRYCLDFSEGALSAPMVKPLREALLQAQETLGELNDFYVAQAFYQRLQDSQPASAWFAIGWLRAMQEQNKARAQEVFMRLPSLRPGA